MITEVNDQNYDSIVKNSEKLTVLDFYAKWCSGCPAMVTILNEISNENANDLNIVKIDVDDNPELTTKFQIKNLPTIFFIKDDKILDKQVGTVPKSKIMEKINKIK